MAWTEKSKYQPPYSKEIQDWLDKGGKITVVPPKESAKKLLIEAFADEVIDKVDSEELRIWIKEKLD